jgi:hypothetical protein
LIIQSIDRFVYKLEASYFSENLSFCESPLKNKGLSVNSCDFPGILDLSMYWKLCGLDAWAVDRDSVSVHHGHA